MAGIGVIGDPRLELLYNYWRGKRGRKSLPFPDDIRPAELPKVIQPNVMLLEVIRTDGIARFRYCQVGTVFWHGNGSGPTGKFVDEILPETAGYRKYVVGIYEEMAATRRPMYTENLFVLQHGHSDPMSTKRVSLPLSRTGEEVDQVLAAHVFDYGGGGDDDAFALVTGLEESVRAFLD